MSPVTRMKHNTVTSYDDTAVKVGPAISPLISLTDEEADYDEREGSPQEGNLLRGRYIRKLT